LFNLGAIIGIFVGGYLQIRFNDQVQFAISILYLLSSIIGSFLLLRRYQPHASRVLSQKPLRLNHLPAWIVGIAMVGKLSPHGLEGSFMWIWQLFIGAGAISATFLGRYTTLHTHGKSNHAFSTLFGNIGATVLALGLVVIACYLIGCRMMQTRD